MSCFNLPDGSTVAQIKDVQKKRAMMLVVWCWKLHEAAKSTSNLLLGEELPMRSCCKEEVETRLMLLLHAVACTQ